MSESGALLMPSHQEGKRGDSFPEHLWLPLPVFSPFLSSEPPVPVYSQSSEAQSHAAGHKAWVFGIPELTLFRVWDVCTLSSLTGCLYLPPIFKRRGVL